MRVRDTQRQKVYDWEDSQSWMIKKSYLTEEQCHECVKKLNKVFKKKINLVFKTGRGKSFMRYNNDTIYLRKDWAKDYAVILHEYAHALEPFDQHNKYFVSSYCLLLHYFHPNKPTLSSLAKSLNESNIDFANFDKCKSKKLSYRIKPFPVVETTCKKEQLRKIVKRKSSKEIVFELMDKYPFLDVFKENFNIWVYGSFNDSDENDPYYDNHFCEDGSWVEAKHRCYEYIKCYRGEV